jgi:hypothetical protein
VREAPTCANTSRQITGTTCDCGQIVGTVWARTASARPRRLKATGAVVTTKTAIDAIVSWCARRSCIETSSTVSRSRNSAPDRDLGRSPHTGQALILIPGATAAFVSRRRVPRSHADSSIVLIRRTRARGSGGATKTREKTAAPSESSGRQVAGDDASGLRTLVPNRPSQRARISSSKSHRCWMSPTTARRRRWCRCRPRRLRVPGRVPLQRPRWPRWADRRTDGRPGRRAGSGVHRVGARQCQVHAFPGVFGRRVRLDR